MLALILGIVFLVAGYFTYGRIVERIIGPDDRPTPAIAQADGVDYVVLPKWKNLLIQLLNIAGIGPVIGVIAGIKFGKVALVIIPIGCVFAGAVHDFLGGMASIRSGGANLPKIVRDNLGRGYSAVFSWLMVLILLLVVAVFINVPANLIDKHFLPDTPFFWGVVGVIFLYYIAATLFPVDKIIGRFYPVFGALLLVGSIAIFCALLLAGFKDPSLLQESEAFRTYHDTVFNAGGRSPIFPLLFVTIACGIISGFHATQSPIVARTMRSEREARATFYGMMIAEGVIAMIWAAAALAIYNLQPEDLNIVPADVLGHITTHFLGTWMGGITVLAVIVLAITSGDTALRSTRLSLAEMFRLPQAKFISRLTVCVPLIAVVAGLLWWSNQSAKTFGYLWNYFAWGNQLLSTTTLMACSVWLLRNGKGVPATLTALIPGMFMTTVIVSFILWTTSAYGQPYGFGLPLKLSIAIGVATAVVFAIYVFVRGRRTQSSNDPK
ncbi:MAG: carbon starvation protein A [Kiritimatiellae bacterium]|nr:carbon starvation protein A [Kiritimatiellia bacterium]